MFECCPVDPSHTIWYGLIINVLQLFRNRVFDPATRVIFDQRLLYYHWPTGTTRITFNIGSAKLKRWSFSIYKQIALILPALFWNLIDGGDFHLILDITEVVEFYATPSYSLAKTRDVATKAFNTMQTYHCVFLLITQYPST